MKLLLPLVAVLFSGAVVLVDAADDAAAQVLAKKGEQVQTQKDARAR